MRELFIPFRSRSEAIKFYEQLLSYRIVCKIINTPSSAMVGCGLSVKLFAKDMAKARAVLNRGGFYTAIGVYYFTESGGVIKM